MPIALISDNPDEAQRQGELALLSAAARGELEAVQGLLSWVQRANARFSGMGDTPLIGAARHGHLAVASALLDTGRADPHARTLGGDCAASIAIRLSNTPMAKLLAPHYDTKGEALNDVNILFHAVEQNAPKSLMLEIGTPERAAARDGFNRTPLILFCGLDSRPGPKDARFLISISDIDARSARDEGGMDREGRDMPGLPDAGLPTTALDAAIGARNWSLARTLFARSSQGSRGTAILWLLAIEANWLAKHPQGNPVEELLRMATDEELLGVFSLIRPRIDETNAQRAAAVPSQAPIRLESSIPTVYARWLALHEETVLRSVVDGVRDANVPASVARPATRL